MGENFFGLTVNDYEKFPYVEYVSRFALCDVILKNKAELSVCRPAWLEFTVLIGAQ
jgi:hypothetical protein